MFTLPHIKVHVELDVPDTGASVETTIRLQTCDCKPIQRNPYLWLRYRKGRQHRKYDRVKRSQLALNVFETIIWEIASLVPRLAGY